MAQLPGQIGPVGAGFEGELPAKAITYGASLGVSRAIKVVGVRSSNLSPSTREVRFMVHPRKSGGRGERHSAAWGKRLSLVLLLATGLAFGQRQNNLTTSEAGRTESFRIAPELARLLVQARHASAPGQTVNVIVQYRQVPTASHYATMQGRGGRLHVKLHMIKSAAFTIPVSALPALEADPEIASVSIDHPL